MASQGKCARCKVFCEIPYRLHRLPLSSFRCPVCFGPLSPTSWASQLPRRTWTEPTHRACGNCGLLVVPAALDQAGVCPDCRM